MYLSDVLAAWLRIDFWETFLDLGAARVGLEEILREATEGSETSWKERKAAYEGPLAQPGTRKAREGSGPTGAIHLREQTWGRAKRREADISAERGGGSSSGRKRKGSLEGLIFPVSVSLATRIAFA
jgi:hypothetical protein